MNRKLFAVTCQTAIALLMMSSLAFGQGVTAPFQTGKIELQSVSQLAFGPEAVLFVADSLKGAIYAIDTKDTQSGPLPAGFEVKAIDEQIAAVVGAKADQILINDVKVNPLSRMIYLAISRGRGPDGMPVILRLDRSGKLSEFSLANVRYTMVGLPNAPVSTPDAPIRNTPEGPRNGNPRVETITDMSYVDGKLIVAGLSNEEFSSDLRSIPFPFKAADRGTSIQIWHAAHGRYETQSPVRTFIPYMVHNEQHILAAYTCTPLVKIPVSALKPGTKVVGKTIAELGAGNRPLEMLAYSKGTHDYILMANSTRGVMKLAADNLGDYKAITPPTAACEQSSEPARGPKECVAEISGVPYETLADIKGVWQLAKVDQEHALVLSDSKGSLSFVVGNAQSFSGTPAGSLDLKMVALP